MHEKREEILFGEPFENYPYVVLTDSEQEKLERRAVRMDELHFSNQRLFRGNPNVLGLKGEYAVSKYYELDRELVVGCSDGGWDFSALHLPSGECGTIDVKTISFSGGDMLMPSDHDLRADLYLLVEKRGDAFGLIGTARRSTVADARIEEPGRYSPSEVRRVERENLREVPPPEDLEKPPKGRTLSAFTQDAESGFDAE